MRNRVETYFFSNCPAKKCEIKTRSTVSTSRTESKKKKTLYYFLSPIRAREILGKNMIADDRMAHGAVVSTEIIAKKKIIIKSTRLSTLLIGMYRPTRTRRTINIAIPF